METEQSILDRIQRRQLKWYGHLLRMEDSRFPKIYQWTPHGKRRRGRPEQSRKNQATDFMEEGMAEDTHLWRLAMDRRLLAVQILIIIKIYLVSKLTSTTVRKFN